MSEVGKETTRFSANVSRYGREEPLPQRVDVRAGPLTAVLEGGDLRYVTVGDDPVVLRLYAAVRDRNWNTIEPRYLSYEVAHDDNGFTVTFEAEHVGGDVDFVWTGSITGTPDGVITATMDGVARKDFQRNRIGWCVLHPMAVAGEAASTETPDGTVEGVFPVLIAPHQPFFDMQSIAHRTPGGGDVVIRFEGDLWEMEDQRNWTDASFKTYCTPLRDPYPVEVKAGTKIRQTVTIQVLGADSSLLVGKGLRGEAGGGSRLSEGPPSPAAAHRQGFPHAGRPGGEAYRVPTITIGGQPAMPLPPIGLGVASHGQPLIQEEVAALRRLRLAHLRVTLELTRPEWEERLDDAA
ncbi:MAG: hypothetical protein H0T18_05665, partial [Chloroflexia bacterium]|nr:hypothetical protein [Chloroflexia bacterium]